ncbi:hypothetical protein J4405_01055 [Candidatus Woesearchaeota archaeon]|nr:hypothetical protein [Candidatus Woesearchaeota archaeon]
MDKNILLVIILIGLIILGTVQAVQINNLKGKIVGNTGATYSSNSQYPAASPVTNSQPAMVGGC